MSRGVNTVTKEMMKGWAETYDEAIETLLWVANESYDQDDLIESIEIFYDEEVKDDNLPLRYSDISLRGVKE